MALRQILKKVSTATVPLLTALIHFFLDKTRSVIFTRYQVETVHFNKKALTKIPYSSLYYISY